MKIVKVAWFHFSAFGSVPQSKSNRVTSKRFLSVNSPNATFYFSTGTRQTEIFLTLNNSKLKIYFFGNSGAFV